MQNGFLKVGAYSPSLRVADCAYNAEQIILATHEAAVSGVKLIVTPELGICGYTCGDLLLQDTLLDHALVALGSICSQTANLNLVLVVGLPVRHRGKLYNCGAVLTGGRVLGLVPKGNLPNYAEHYELRHFTPAFAGVERIEAGPLRGVPIGAQILFRCEQMPEFTLAVELCEDLWVPAPPSIFHAVSGATVIANLSASCELAGKAQWRRQLVTGHCGRLACSYLYADAGDGESTSDLVFSGHNMVAELGTLLAENTLFSGQPAITELDLGRIQYERRKQNTFPDAGSDNYLTAWFPLQLEPTVLTRPISSTPFVPEGKENLAQRCETVFDIQMAGLAKRLIHTDAACVAIGVSGGLDSTLALLVAARTLERLGRAPSHIAAITMPGFGTSKRTRNNAGALCEALGIPLEEIDITNTVRAHFADIGHTEDVHDVVFENAQARVRTLTLMDIANQRGGLVLGTGDLSELALGWATYNGDHMSMYGVNASVPKTLVRHLVAYQADITTSPALRKVLHDILDTPVSPELLPAQDGKISQETEQIIGPYELHDFYLYHALRWGCPPKKLLVIAESAFQGKYFRAEILKWMRVFFRRFFSQQFKRNCMPDGPKVGSVALSPRGDWRMPSDAAAAAWMSELDGMAE